MIDTFSPPVARPRRSDIFGQRGLFPWLGSERPRIADPPAIVESPTSRAAARRIAAHAPTLRERLLDAFREAGPRGLTDEEGMRAARIPGNSYRPRRGHLQQFGLIEVTNRTRPTASGDRARVYRLAEAAP